MEISNQQFGRSAEGKIGMYYNSGIADQEICFEPNEQSGIGVIQDFIFIPANRIATLCTELIEMARVLGVTGGQDGT